MGIYRNNLLVTVSGDNLLPSIPLSLKIVLNYQLPISIIEIEMIDYRYRLGLLEIIVIALVQKN